MRLSVVFKEKRDKFFLIKQFHLIEKKNSMKNKHCLLLEKFSLFFDKSEPVSTALLLQHFFFFSIFFFMISLEPEIYFMRLQRGCRMGRGKDHINNAIFFFCKRHRNSLRIWPENPVNASGDIKRTHRFSELALQGPVGPHSICRFVTLAFCHFKWLHIILYLHVPWLFPFTLFQLIYSLDF